MQKRQALRTALLLAALSACVGQASPPSSPGAAQPAAPAAAHEGEHENLQVLPDTISHDALIAVMRNFTNALGVRCTYCHVGPENAPPDSMDFVSDDKEAKNVTRGMMRLVQSINGDLLPRIPELGENRMPVGCITCHRGAARPVMLEDTLYSVAQAMGVDSAVAAYGRLRQRYYGRSTYDFGERSLALVARRLQAEGRQAEGRRILELNVEQFPNSAALHYELGLAYEQGGDRERAIASYRRALAIQPGLPPVVERLQALGVQP
jgi:photosynthetic reaction center cytochrome c subunit